jgi:hypothetical protein
LEIGRERWAERGGCGNLYTSLPYPIEIPNELIRGSMLESLPQVITDIDINQIHYGIMLKRSTRILTVNHCL